LASRIVLGGLLHTCETPKKTVPTAKGVMRSAREKTIFGTRGSIASVV
jgi:hypothetical protein